jgi:dienelactone hydrolase
VTSPIAAKIVIATMSPTPVSPPGLGRRATFCRQVAFYGANNTHVNASVASFAEAMRIAGKSFEYHTYEGAGRGFFNDTKPNYYNVQASRDSFARLLTFLLKTLTE